MFNFIEEWEITPARLSVELERAVIQHKTQDDGTLYVDEDSYFPFWISIHPAFGLVGLRSHIYLRDSIETEKILTLVNSINCVNYSLCCYYEHKRVNFDCMLGIRDGMLANNLIRSARNFSATINDAIRKNDPNYETLKPIHESAADLEGKNV